MLRAHRTVSIVLGAIVVLSAGGYFGLRMYLGSDSVKQVAAAKLSEKLGGDVRVVEMTSDLGSTSLKVEIQGNAADPPLATGRIRVDVSPIGLAAGKSPRSIQIENALVYLHLNQDGDIISKLPHPPGGAGGGPLPEIDVEGATVHIVQDGKPDFQISGVDLKVVETDGKLKIEGKIADAEFGSWNLGGEWATSRGGGAILADTVGTVHATPHRLKSIPFVPTETWEYIELDGNTPVKVRVGRNADSKWTWRVECEPTNARLKVFPIDLELTETSGKVVVDGAQVTLSGVHGKAADGLVKTDATLDFGHEPTRLEFKVKADNLDVTKTPASWGLAKRVDEGRMNGGGDITLVIADGKVRPEGKGKAIIKGKLFGGDYEAEVFLSGDGKRLRFQDAPEKTLQAPNRAADFALLKLLTATLLQAPAATPPAVPPSQMTPETEYVRANLKLRNVDIAQLVEKANLGSPVKLAGKVTLEVSAEIPTSNTGSIKLYRATGKLSTPSLQIEDLTLSQVTADVQLRDGVLKLTRFSAEFPKGTGTKAGGFLGTASFGIDPRTDLVADLTLDDIPLGQVFAALPGLQGKADGVLSGAFHLKIPGDKLSDVKSYEADGKLSSTGITVFGQKADRLSVQLLLKNGVAELTKAEGGLYSGTVTGEARLPLVGKDTGAFKIGFKHLDSAALVKAIPDSPVKLSGKVDGKLEGTLPPVEGFEVSKITGNLDLTSTKLIVEGIPATKLSGKLRAKPGAITYALKGDALGGSFDVEGTYPLGEKDDPKKPGDKPAGGTIRLDRLRLDRLARDLRINSLEPLGGILSLSLKYTHGPDGPTGSGRIEIRNFGWGDTAFESSDIVSDIRITADGLEIPTLSGELAGGSLRGRVRYDFDQPRKSFLALRVDNAEAATLLSPLGLKVEGGRVSASIHSTLGKELRGSGTVIASRVKLDGVDVSELRIPLTWAFSRGGAARLTIRDAAGTVANGRVTARTEVTWNGSARVDGRVEFVDVNVGDLAKGFGSSSYGIGKTTGRFDFNGDEVRTADDLQGTLTARFGQTTVRELPLIGSASSLLSPVQALTRFDSGELVARLGAGQFRLERLSLASPSAKLYGEGTVALNGRLDLDVVYNTGQIGPSAPLLRIVLRDIPAIGPIPVGLIVRVTETLSNRVVRLRIGGTTERPVVQVNAAKLLSENAVRFFVGQYVPLSATSR